MKEFPRFSFERLALLKGQIKQTVFDYPVQSLQGMRWRPKIELLTSREYSTARFPMYLDVEEFQMGCNE